MNTKHERPCQLDSEISGGSADLSEGPAFPFSFPLSFLFLSQVAFLCFLWWPRVWSMTVTILNDAEMGSWCSQSQHEVK